MRVGVWAALVVAALARPAAGQDSTAQRPYDVRVVCLLGEHRMLATEAFREEFPREVRERVQRTLGGLVRLESSLSHPLGDPIRRDGLDAVLDGHDEVSSVRTWFFVVRFHDGQFELSGRFFDGLTGLAGPPAKSVATSDRGRLAALAARMIVDPFPLVGDVVSVNGDTVELLLHGGAIDGDATPRRSAVFAISRLANESGVVRGHRLPWAVLEAKSPPVRGRLTCQLWRRYREDRLGTDGVRYRALMLPTITAPVTLRIVDAETGSPVSGLRVRVAGGTPREIDVATGVDGRATTPTPIANLALIKLTQGSRVVAQFPVPVVDSRTVVSPVSLKPEAEEAANLRTRRQQQAVRILEASQLADRRFAQQRLLLGQSLEAAREHAQQTARLLGADLAAIQAERAEIRRLMAEHKFVDADDADKGIKRLLELRKAVIESIERIGVAIAERDTQTEKQKAATRWIEQGALFESQSDFAAAIENYEKGVANLSEPGKYGEHLERLRRAWEIQSEAHREAREFLTNTWPKLDPNLLREHFPKAESALETCRMAEDRLTPRVFQAANQRHLAEIARAVDPLKRSRTPADAERLREWDATVSELRRLNNAAAEQIRPKE